MTFWETVARGEYVMIALAVFLIICVCIWWVRGVKLGREKSGYGDLMHRVRDHVTEGDIDNAGQLCTVHCSAGGRMLESGLHRLGHPMSEVRSAMNEVAQIEKSKMENGEGWLRALAVISPLLGLGGTLVGIIESLRDLGESSIPVDMSQLCAAIAPAIVTTVAGLGVGIFAIFAYTCLNIRVDSAKRSLDELAAEFTSLLNEPT